MTTKRWRIVLGRSAEDDFSNIAAWTSENFGDRHAEAYVDAMLDALEELSANPFQARSRARDEIGPGLRTLHLSKRGRRGRHLFLYRTEDNAVVVLRILHDSMEISSHLPED
jgi:toxin ParE1/3/4